MKKILLSIVAGVVLASCGSMQQATTSNTTSNTTTTEQSTTTQTTTNQSVAQSANSAISSLLGGLTQGSTQTTVTESYTAGQQSGVALKALYNQYKADGKLDFSNLSNVANIMNVAAQVQKIKDAETGSVDYKDFSKGLIEGSVNLVNELNSEKVIETLTSTLSNVDSSTITDKVNETKTQVTEVKDKAQTAATNVSTAATSIMEVLSLFKQQ